MTGRMGRMQWNVCYIWKKVWISHYWNCTNWPLTEMTPICVTSLGLIIWMSRWNPTKNWVTMQPTCARRGSPESGMAEYLFDKHILGNRDNESLALCWLPVVTGMTSLVIKAVHLCLGYTYLSSFLSTTPSNKVIWCATLPSHPKRKKKCEKKIWEVCVPNHFSHVWFLATLWTVARHTPLFMEFSRHEYWNGLPRPPPEDLPDSGIKPMSPALQVNSLPPEPPGKPYGRFTFF